MSHRVALLATIIAGLVVSESSAQLLEEDVSRLTIADCHVHLVDFLQNGDYLENGDLVYSDPEHTLPSGQRGKRIEAILEVMDDFHVSHAIISGMPFVKKWSEQLFRQWKTWMLSTATSRPSTTACGFKSSDWSPCRKRSV